MFFSISLLIALFVCFGSINDSHDWSGKEVLHVELKAKRAAEGYATSDHSIILLTNNKRRYNDSNVETSGGNVDMDIDTGEKKDQVDSPKRNLFQLRLISLSLISISMDLNGRRLISILIY